MQKTVPRDEARQKLISPWGRGKWENTRVAYPTGQQTNNIRQHVLHIMACEVVILSSDTVGNLGMRSKGLIEYRKHESP